MSSLLEHICTLFFANANSQESFLKIILDARGVGLNALSAKSNSNFEIIISAQTRTYTQAAILNHHVCQILSLPVDVNVCDAQFILLRNGYLAINIPLCPPVATGNTDNNETVTECIDSLVCADPCQSKSIEPAFPIVCNQLDKHETLRHGNLLTLKIPMEKIFKKEHITVKVVERSVCISAVYTDMSMCGKPYNIQRTFYKEYEASDCIPDPRSVVFDLIDDFLFVKVCISMDT